MKDILHRDTVSMDLMPYDCRHHKIELKYNYML